MEGTVFLSGAHFQVIIGSTSDAEKKCGCSGKNGDGESNVGGSISQHSNALADKNLVNDVVEGADQHTDDGRNGKFGNEFAHRGTAQWIFRNRCRSCV